MKTYGMWIALFFIVQAVLTAVQYFTARKPVKLPIRIVLILAKALIAAALALLQDPTDSHPIGPECSTF